MTNSLPDEEYENAKKSLKIKIGIYLSIAILVPVMFFIYMAISFFTYEESNHTPKPVELSIVSIITLEQVTESQIFYTLNDDTKKVYNMNVSCILQPKVSGKKYSVSFVTYNYKDMFREGKHSRIVGLNDKICKFS